MPLYLGHPTLNQRCTALMTGPIYPIAARYIAPFLQVLPHAHAQKT